MWESLNLCHFPRGYGMAKHGNVVVAFSTPISCGCGHLDSYSYSQQVHAPPYAVKYRIGRRSFVSGDTCEYISLLTSSGLGQRQLRHNNYRLSRSGRARIRAAIDFASAVDVINDLGLDTLTFLAVIVAVLPTFKLLRASPILGFFFAGVVLNQFGFIRNLTDVKVLSEWGILFLIIGLIFNRGSKIHRPLPLQLFEMGLELSFARLKALAKFAFGMGLTQVHPLQRHRQTLLSPRRSALFSPQDPLRIPPEKAAAAAAPCGGFCSSVRSRRSFRGGVVAMAVPGSVRKSEEEWQAVMSPEQFRILRQKGTEYPGTGEYDKYFEEGVYNCAGCGTPLYRSTTKFNSGCGWPAFYEGLPGAITSTPDPDGMRTEITCTACGGHLGHVFKGEGFPTPTDERHCVNSISLKFVPVSSNPSQSTSTARLIGRDHRMRPSTATVIQDCLLPISIQCTISPSHKSS